MAQVVRPQGFIGPLVTMVIGAILLFNGVPGLLQWIGWIGQSALVVGIESAFDTAFIPLILSAAASIIGLAMVRGGFTSLRGVLRGAGQRAREQVRGGVQQVRREAGQRYGEAVGQAEHLQNAVPQSWRERIEAAAREVEGERARRSGAQPQVHASPQQRPQQPRPQAPRQPQPQPQPQRQGQGQQGYPGQGQQGYQGQQDYQGQAAYQGQQQRQPQPAPGSDRLARIEQLRRQVDSRVQQQVGQLQDAGRQAADRVRQAATDEAARVQQRQLPNPSDEVTALIGRLDLADNERIRRRGSSLTRSSLATSSLSKTSLTLNSLLQHRR
ncbi:hypothetical protein [Agrococcus sp. SCSIO52902]|uniref:hypothetical protein n=1 Tax=Agrococcus sp. SCSIO52902 TaxID=2933290 RepID=UPI001FF6A619|nr:hypothetical protein [Agrococcus sp. SCSIO52902]UOW01448.1 hypothetical protein MU522_03280 [Agrococcus sp. SCSIO52902]